MVMLILYLQPEAESFYFLCVRARLSGVWMKVFFSLFVRAVAESVEIRINIWPTVTIKNRVLFIFFLFLFLSFGWYMWKKCS